MNKLRQLIAVLALVGSASIISCNENPFGNTSDPGIPAYEQYPDDSLAIVAYFAEKGLDSLTFDTAFYNGYPVYYAVLEEGDGDTIEYDDIVKYDYIINTHYDDSVKATTIPAIAQANEILDITATYTQVEFTYAKGTWTIPSIFVSRTEPGYKLGVTSIFQKIKVGGRGIMIIPSVLAYYSAYDTDISYSVKTAYDSVEETYTTRSVVIEDKSNIILQVLPVSVQKPYEE